MVDDLSQTTLDALAEALGQALSARRETLVTAESCTGGWVAQCLTAVAGASGWFDRGFVVYSDEAKAELLGVNPELLRTHGAVSEAVARAMASGAFAHSSADWALAITGIAGPGGGSAEKPIGTVWFAWAFREAGKTNAVKTLTRVRHFEGTRKAVRHQSVDYALRSLLAFTVDGRLKAGGME